MAFVAGKDAVFKLDNSGGSLVDLSTYITDVSHSLDTATAETTSLGKDDTTLIATIGSASLSVTGLFDATLLAHLGAVRGSSSSLSYEFYPAGTPSGLPKVSGECVLTNMSPSASVGGVEGLSFSLECTGAQTIGTA